MDEDDVMRLRKSINRLARQLHAHPSSEGLTPTQASVLGLIAGYGSFSLSEIAEIEDLNPTMLSRIVAHLESRDLIQRLPDPDDGRVVRVSITEQGAGVHEKIKDERTELIYKCTTHLTPRQTAALVRAIPSLEALTYEVQRATRERNMRLGNTK